MSTTPEHGRQESGATLRERHPVAVALLLAVAVAGVVAVAVLTLAGGRREGATPADALAAAIAGDPAQASGASPAPSRIVWPEELVCPSERSFKADQIEQLGYAPEVVFFGGSRSSRFEPSYLRQLTGLWGLNLAMTNSRPEDAWVFAHFLHERAPAAPLRWIWGVQPSTLVGRDLEAGLVQDPRLNRYLPADLLRVQGSLLPQTPDAVPERGAYELRAYSYDGVILRNTYDRLEARGRTLAESLEKYVDVAVEKQQEYAGDGGGRVTRTRRYFEATLAYLNDIGVRPVLVGMPVHPQVIAALRLGGWQQRHDRFVAYLAALRDQYEFDFVDLTDIASFGGDPEDFYDGVHIKTANSRRIIDLLVRTFPETFVE